MKVPKSKNKRKFIIIISILSISLIITFFITIILITLNTNVNKLLEKTNIYNNISINGINLSGLSKEDAFKTLSENSFLNEKIIFNHNDLIFEYSKTDFGTGYNFEKALEKAYALGREGNKNQRYKQIKYLENNPENIILEKIIDENTLNQNIAEIEKNINKPPKNAYLEKNKNEFKIIENEYGIKINKDKLKDSILKNIIEDGNIYLDIPFEKIPAEYNVESIKKIKDKLGSFSTKFINGKNDSARITNMKLASESINGTLLYPNEVFSTNKKFGSTTKAKGYKPAPIIINGKLEDEYGGGVCQISSTLYNAVLYSELDIVERKNHSLKVGYLDYGYDATLAGDYIDFKFKNSTPSPIFIESYLTENQVICNIYGVDEREKNREIKFQNALIEKIQPAPKIIKYTDELDENENKVEVTQLAGYKYKLYKLIYINGKLTEKVLINNSYYKPREEKILIGTRKVKSVLNNNLKETTETTEQPITTTEENFTEIESYVEEIIEISTELQINETITEIE